MSFDRMTPVLHFGPDPLPLRYRERKDRLWLLWPAFGYQVIVPVPRERPFNLFQEYVIKLCRAGVREAAELGRRLGFGTELAAFIVVQLQQMQMLDDHGTPTTRAIRELEEAEASPSEAVAGYVFQDPFTGALWPRFAPGSPGKAGIERVTNDAELKTWRFDLVLGTAGNPERPKAASVIPDQDLTWASPPSAQAILGACREHRRFEQNYLRACRRDLGAGADGRVARLELPTFLEEVSLVSATAQPFFLTTYLFVPEDETRVGHWQVCDPFGLGPSLALRKQIEGMTAHEPGGLLSRLVQRVTDQSYAVNPVELSEERAANQRRAAASVEAELGQEIREYPDLYRRLIDAEKALQEARVHAGKAGGSQKEYLSRLKDFVARSFHALEELCDVVFSQYPAGDGQATDPGEVAAPGDTLAALSAVAEENAELLGKIAARIGLRDSEPPVFPVFFRMSRAQAKHIVSHDGRKLHFQFAVMVATARDIPEHPLYRLGAEFPDCVSFLLDLKRQRDGGVAHAGDVLLREDTMPLRTGLYRVVRGLLPGMRRGPGEAAPAEGDPVDTTAALAHQRLRARAMLAIHQRFGTEVRARRKVYAHLLDMQTRLEELRVPTDDGQEDRGLLASGLLREGCGAVEAALADLARAAHPVAKLPSLDRDKRGNASRFVEAAKDLGFDLESGGLPEALVTVPVDRLEKTIRSRSGTLNALAMALLWAAQSDPDHPLRSVARARPSLLVDIAKLSVRRGHGDRPRLPLQEVEPTAGVILALVETVLMFVP